MTEAEEKVDSISNAGQWYYSRAGESKADQLGIQGRVSVLSPVENEGEEERQVEEDDRVSNVTDGLLSVEDGGFDGKGGENGSGSGSGGDLGSETIEV